MYLYKGWDSNKLENQRQYNNILGKMYWHARVASEIQAWRDRKRIMEN